MRVGKVALATLALCAALVGAGNVFGCTNYLVTKGASVDGSVLISYAADSHYLYGELYHWPAAVYPKGALYKVYEWDTGKYLGEIPQAERTYNVVGNVNEHQVMIGETTYGGRHELVDPNGIIDYGSLIYLALQRSTSARDAIKTMVELVAEHGYASSGESFSIADKDEVWILELIGKGPHDKDLKKTPKGKVNRKGAVWVARMVPDGYVSGHANQARITTFPLADGKTSITDKQLKQIYDRKVTTVYSHDVIQLAREMGYFNGKDAEFSFSDTYAPVDFGAARACEARVFAFFNAVRSDMGQYLDYAKGENLTHRMPLWIKPEKKLSQHDVMQAMRNHFEGFELDMTQDVGAGPWGLPYRWRPLDWEYKGQKYVNERATATQQTGFVFVGQARSWMPDAVGCILWFGMDDADATVFTPMYGCMTSIPEAFREGNGSLLEYSSTSAFWLFNKVANFTYLRYKYMHADLKRVQERLEKGYIEQVEANSKQLAALYGANPAKAVAEATAFSTKCAENTMAEWNKLFEFLLIKYIDGNIKVEENGVFKASPDNPRVPVKVLNPEYPDWWKEAVVKSTGDKLKVR